MKPTIILALAVAAFGASPVMAQKADKQLMALVAMTPEDFAAKVEITDDELETVARLSTRPAFQYKSGGLFKSVEQDVFLRAFVDKTNGEVIYQIYYVSPAMSDWARFHSVNMMGPDGVMTVDARSIDSDVDCSRYGCSHWEQVVAELPVEFVEWLAGQYRAGEGNSATFRFKSNRVGNADVNIMPAEAAGLVMAVNAYMAKRGIGDPASTDVPVPEESDPKANEENSSADEKAEH